MTHAERHGERRRAGVDVGDLQAGDEGGHVLGGGDGPGQAVDRRVVDGIDPVQIGSGERGRGDVLQGQEGREAARAGGAVAVDPEQRVGPALDQAEIAGGERVGAAVPAGQPGAEEIGPLEPVAAIPRLEITDGERAAGREARESEHVLAGAEGERGRSRERAQRDRVAAGAAVDDDPGPVAGDGDGVVAAHSLDRVGLASAREAVGPFGADERDQARLVAVEIIGRQASRHHVREGDQGLVAAVVAVAVGLQQGVGAALGEPQVPGRKGIADAVPGIELAAQQRAVELEPVAEAAALEVGEAYRPRPQAREIVIADDDAVGAGAEGDREIGVDQGQVERVGALAGVDDRGETAIDVDVVGAGAPDDGQMVGATICRAEEIETVVAVAAVEQQGARRRVGQAVDGQIVAAALAEQLVVAAIILGQHVRAGAAEDLVVAELPVQSVVIVAAMDDVVAGAAVDLVAAEAAIDRVGAAGAEQVIVSIRAGKDQAGGGGAVGGEADIGRGEAGGRHILEDREVDIAIAAAVAVDLQHGVGAALDEREVAGRERALIGVPAGQLGQESVEREPVAAGAGGEVGEDDGGAGIPGPGDARKADDVGARAERDSIARPFMFDDEQVRAGAGIDGAGCRAGRFDHVVAVAAADDHADVVEVGREGQGVAARAAVEQHRSGHMIAARRIEDVVAVFAVELVIAAEAVGEVIGAGRAVHHIGAGCALHAGHDPRPVGLAAPLAIRILFPTRKLSRAPNSIQSFFQTFPLVTGETISRLRGRRRNKKLAKPRPLLSMVSAGAGGRHESVTPARDDASHREGDST